MSKEELHDRVHAWISNTGLPLELDAKVAFSKANFQVSHSTLYVDPESEKGREIDLVAYHRDHIGLIQVFFVVECKASGDPWVVLSDRNAFGGIGNYSLGIVSDNVKDALPKDWASGRNPIGEILGRMHAGGYALKQAFSKQNDAAYGAAISVLKASRAVVAKQVGDTPRYKFAIPVIVVDAPIFDCHLAESGELELRQVAYSEVHFTAYIPDYTVASIRIVRKSELPYFAKACDQLARGIRSELDHKVQEWIAELKAKADANKSKA